MKDTRLDNVEIDNEITKHPKKRNSFDDETDAASRPARAYTFPKENDIYTREDSSKMSSFNILANCAAKELKLLTKTREGGGKENQARMPIDSSASDIEDDLNIEFPVIVSGGKKLFKCIYPDCRKAFPSLSRMRRHYIIHTGAKPFKCLNAECPKSFSRRDNMIQHYKGHCIYTKRYPRNF